MLLQGGGVGEHSPVVYLVGDQAGSFLRSVLVEVQEEDREDQTWREGPKECKKTRMFHW